MNNYFDFCILNAMFCVFLPVITPWVGGEVFNMRLPMQNGAMGDTCQNCPYLL